MRTIDDVASWVQNDILHRTNDTNIQTVCRNAALKVYKIVCAAVPFDELQLTSAEFPVVSGQENYVVGTDIVLNPTLRAVADIRITFDSSNKRRLRRSHSRVYDALSFTPTARPSSYARQGLTLILNPPPDSSVYTLRFRYWSRPAIGVLQNITGAVWGAGSAVFSVASSAGISNTDPVQVTGVSPAGYNGDALVVSSTTANSVTVAMAANPGLYVDGGLLNDQVNFQTTVLVTPEEWDELLGWETLYRVYYALDQPDKAAALIGQNGFPRQPSPRKQKVFETGIIPRLWNDLLKTMSQQENVDEDFSINPIIRSYSVR